MKYPDDFLNKIICGDCLSLFEYVPDNTVGLIITDPPYGVNNAHWDSPEKVFSLYRKWLAEMYRLLSIGGHCYIFAPTKEIHTWIQGVIDMGFNYQNLLATQVYPIQNKSIKNNFVFDSQFIIFCTKGLGRVFNQVDWIPTTEGWRNDKRNPDPKDYTYSYPSFVRPEWGRANIKANSKTKLLHKNQKSEELIGKFIELSSNEGDLVLDPFMGSGTTCVAAKRLNRNYIGIEISEEYYKIAEERIKKVVVNAEI